MMERIQVENLSFTLYRSQHRKTVGITIDRDGKLILRVPVNCDLTKAKQVAEDNLLWTYKKLAEKEMYFLPAHSKKYISGEGFFFLGTSYRLLLVDEIDNEEMPLIFRDGWFLLLRTERNQAEKHFVEWYQQKAYQWLKERLKNYVNRIDVAPKKIDVCNLGFRWGTCSHEGDIKFHWKIILLPPEIIDYIIVHELVHLNHPHHDAHFWGRVERVIPDYLRKKQWLLENGNKF